MTWEDRIRGAIYTSPSGVEFNFFDYEDVLERTVKKTTQFTFPAVDGSYIQDLGNNGRNYPFRFFFSGPDYDIESKSFMSALEEKGRSVFEHPMYGRLDVVPFGQITRRDNLKTEANQAVFDVIFYSSLDFVFPSSSTDPLDETIDLISNYDVAQGEQFDNELELDNVNETVGFKQQLKSALASVRRFLQVIADAQDTIKREFEDAFNLINETIDTLIGTPLRLVADVIDLIRLPGRAIESIQAKMDAYTNLFNSLIGAESDNFEPSFDSQPNNAFLTKNLFSAATVSTMLLVSLDIASQTSTETIVSTTPITPAPGDTQPPFISRSQIISTVDLINSRFEEFVEWSDANRESLDMIDTGEAYSYLQEALARGLGNLIFLSFTAKQEIVFSVDRATTIINLVAELYQTVDSALDFFILTNQLSGDELFEIPMGRQVVYYK